MSLFLSSCSDEAVLGSLYRSPALTHPRAMANARLSISNSILTCSRHISWSSNCKKTACHVYCPGHKQYYRSVVEMSQYNHRALLFDLYRTERRCISCGLGCEHCLQTKAGRTSLTASSTSQTWQSEHSNRHQFSKMVSLQKKIRTGFFVQQLCCLMNVKRDVWQPAEKQGSFEPCSIVRGTGFLLGISPLTFPWAICCIPVSGM